MLRECFDKYAPTGMESVSGRDIRKGKSKLMSMVEEPRSRAFRKRTVIIPIAAAMLAAGTVTAGAANDWNFEKLIAGIYPAAAENSVQMADAVKKLDGMLYRAKDCVTSSTFENYDVTLGDYIFNGKSVMYSIYVRAKDGTPFENFTEIYGYEPVEEDMTIDGRSFGGGSATEVLEDGTLCWHCTKNISGTEITEPVSAAVTFSGLRLAGLSFEDRVRLAIPENELIYDEESRSYCVINGNGEKEGVITYGNKQGDVYFGRMSDYFRELDNGVFKAEIILNPVGEAKPFTLSDGRNSIDIKMTSSYAGIALNRGTAAGGDAAYWAHLMCGAMFIYDTGGNVMLSPDDFENPGIAGCGGGDMESCFCGFPKLIDVDSIGAVRIGGYTFGDAPAADCEKYPYMRDYCGITD